MRLPTMFRGHQAEGIALMVTATFFWSTNFSAIRSISQDIGPFTLSMIRWALATIVLIILGRRTILREATVLLRHWKIMTVLSFSGIVLATATTFMGLRYSTALNAAILQSSGSLVVLVASLAIFGDRASTRQIIAVILSSIGVLVITGRGSIQTFIDLDLNIGDLLLWLGVASYAVFTPLLKLRPPVQPVSFLFANCFLGFLMFLPLCALELIFWQVPHFTPRVVTLSIYSALFPALFSQFCFTRAVALIGANRAGQFQQLTPAFGVGMAMITLGEVMHPYHIAGIALIAVGLALASRIRKGQPA